MSLPFTGPTEPSALDPSQVELAVVARRWLEARTPSSVVRAALEADEESLPPFWDELVDLGWIGLAVGEDAGGQGASLAELATVIEEWGRAVAPGPLPTTAAAATVIGRWARSQLGPDEVDPLLARVLGGEVATIVTGAPAPGHESGRPVDGASLAEWFVLPTGDDTWALVARDDLDVTPVRSADPTRRLALVAVPHDVATRFEFAVPPGAVERVAAVIRAAEAVGVASWCVSTAATHARDRVQFGRPIGVFQGVKHRCADSLCRLELARAVTWDAARVDLDDDESAVAVGAAAALGPTAAFECAKDAIQVLGGIGYTWEHDAHLYLRRATLLHHLNESVSQWRAGMVAAARVGRSRSLRVELPAEAESSVDRSEIATAVAEIRAQDRSEWNQRLADDGWMVPHWPAPWGQDAGPVRQIVIDQELAAAGIRRPHLQVAGWVLPTIIAHGSDQQKERFVFPSLRHEISWCQLFSEPGAGSDLASLTTRATRVEGGWSITGQKVWTTLAKESDYGLCLARTDPVAPRHDGITAFIVDMAAAGIEIRPLRELTGFAMFNEVFFDDVFVPDGHVVGSVNDGWRCARTTLENERVSMAAGSSFGPGVLAVLELATATGALDDGHPDRALVSDRIGELLVTSQALALLRVRTTLRAIGDGSGGSNTPGPESSVGKLMGVEHEQKVQEVGLDLLGAGGAVDEGDGSRWFGGFLGNRALSIAGGTSEIQRNVIGERLLGLPRDDVA